MTSTLAAGWQDALDRAHAEHLTLKHLGDGFAECTSGSEPGKRYLLYQGGCSCKAGTRGQPCKHLALYKFEASLAPFDRQPPVVTIYEFVAATAA